MLSSTSSLMHWYAQSVNVGDTAPQDNKVVDHACVALSRIADSFARSPAQLQVLCEHGLIRNAMQLVSGWTFALLYLCVVQLCTNCTPSTGSDLAYSIFITLFCKL